MSEDNILRIGFSLGSLFDMKEAEEVYANEGLKAYLEYIQDMIDNGETFDPGPALGTYVALRNLNNKIPNEILDIRFGIVSKNTASNDKSDIFQNTYRKLISDIYPESDMLSVDFDYLSFVNGRLKIEEIHQDHGTELSFTTSKESAENIYREGIPSIYIPNTSKEVNAMRYEKKDGDFILVADYDGVIGDVHSEMVYQKAKKMKNEYGMDINPIEEFRMSERDKRDVPMELGPMGKVLQKLSRAETYLKERYDEAELPFELVVVTARGVAAYDRYIVTLRKHNIDVAHVHMMDGTNKNNILRRIAKTYHNENLLFIDDGEIHFERSLELKDVVSGLVMNDFNTGKIKVELNNEDKLKIKDFLSRKQESINEEKNNSENKVRLSTTRIKP